MSPVPQQRKPAAPAAARPPNARASAAPTSPKPEPEILFQRYFKSLGPRTYAAPGPSHLG